MRRSGGNNFMAWYTAGVSGDRRIMPSIGGLVGWTRRLEDGIVNLELLNWSAEVRVE